MHYFCNKTGVRIAAPGVCKSVDPENGQDEVTLTEGGELVPVKAKAPKAKHDAPPPPEEEAPHHAAPKHHK